MSDVQKSNTQEEQFRVALEYIVSNSLYKDAWYAQVAREALGEKNQRLRLILK